MKKRFNQFNFIITIFLLTFFLVNPVTYGQTVSSNEKVSDETYFLMQMESFIKTNYVNEIQDLELLRGAIKGMVESLDDPYSEYYTPDEFKEFNESTSGHFGGIGIVITSKDKYITAVSILEGSPAEKVGIRPGDRLVEIDGEDIVGISSAEASKRLKGEKGEKVVIGVLREGQKQITRYEVERDIIKVNPISSLVLGQGIGYIKISEFNENTVENLDKTLDHFKDSGVVGIVLDLRNNPGGYLDQAVEAASRFVPNGPIVNIVSKEGKIQSYTSDSVQLDFALVVLVNGGSASASEILAGAIKDRQTGILVGEKTFGKGMVQRTLSLGALGGVKLTTAYYTTPNGNNINNTGIVPDILVEVNKTNPVQNFISLDNKKALRYGSVGLEVLGIQQRLKFLEVLDAVPDGVFGPRTEKAIKNLQKKAEIYPSGVVDGKFYEVLDNAIYEKLYPSEDIQLRKGIDTLKDVLKTRAAA